MPGADAPPRQEMPTKRRVPFDVLYPRGVLVIGSDHRIVLFEPSIEDLHGPIGEAGQER